ncbi:MAG: hypothetical protein L0229_05880 [Blastocatellia bacterium]|nr:hypothetical protein [Blastocatellia bacterium]
MEDFTDWTRIEDESEQARLRDLYDENTGEPLLAEIIEAIGTENEARYFKRSDLLTNEDRMRLIGSHRKATRYHQREARAAIKRMRERFTIN